MLQNITLLFPSCFVLRMILPLDLIEFYHFVPSDSLFHPRFLRDAQYKKDQVEEGVLQFPLVHQELANTFLARRHGKHYGLMIKYLRVGDDKQQNHTALKFYKVQHNEELFSHRPQTDAHLSSGIPLGTHGHQLQTTRAFSSCPHKLSNDSKPLSNDSE